MKWRVILAVCFVLIIFASFAYFYVNTFVRKHQHAVILFVVDGLDLNLLHQARQQLTRTPLSVEPDDPLIGDARRRVAYRGSLLNLDSFWDVALVCVQDPGRPVPDEGANATALACGQRVDNGFVAMNTRNEALRSLIYAAEQSQRATGLVTTSSLVRPTPVAFYSNTNGMPDPYRNAQDLVYSGIDVILGGGEQYFTPASATNEYGRPDGRDLLHEAAARYTVIHTRDQLTRLSTWHSRQIFGIFAPADFYFASLRPEQSQQPSLAEMTRVAVSILNHNLNGYFLVVDHGLVARASEQNLGKLAVNEVAEVDEAIQSAVEYAGPDALVLVTNSYNLGAVGPLAASTGEDQKLAVPSAGDSALSAPAALWLTGPGGPPVTKSQSDWLRRRFDQGWYNSDPVGFLQPQPAYSFETGALPTAGPAWVASRGEGALQLRGFLNNTDIFDLVDEQF